MLKRSIISVMFCLFNMAGFSQNISEQTKELKEIEKEIEYIDKQLAANKTSQQRGLEDISFIQRKILNRKDIIAQLGKEIGITDLKIQSVEQDIDSLASYLGKLKEEYSRLIYHAYKNRDRTIWILQVLASRDFEQGYRRWHYLKSYSEALKNSADIIKEQNRKLSMEKEQLDQILARSIAMQQQRREENTKLELEEKDVRQLIGQLSRKEAEFRRQLEEKRREMERLNREIERILAEAAKDKKAPNYVESSADRILTGSFESNKGKLPWPVRDGVIIERFGQHNHPLFPNIKLPFNNGVNISTDPHAEVVCIFDGIVKQLLVMPGYNQCILVQHGDYYTFYTKLEHIAIKDGDNIRRGQVLGTLSESGGTSVIHFQLWKGTEKQNPEQWISKL